MNNRRDQSRCCTPRISSLVWHLFHDEDEHTVVAEEMRKAFPADLPTAVLNARYADVRSLLEDAAAGDIDPLDDAFDPVARDPELWELRWKFEDSSQWRMYHAEPPEAPGYLVAMAFHEKDLVGSVAEVKANQNGWIDRGSRRYTEGRTWHWGMA